jgi:hypothetical protein
MVNTQIIQNKNVIIFSAYTTIKSQKPEIILIFAMT